MTPVLDRNRLERGPGRHHGGSGRQHLFHREQPGPDRAHQSHDVRHHRVRGHGRRGDPHGITTGPDGALWFAEGTDDKIGRVTTGPGGHQRVPGVSGNNLRDITAGPDGNLWFTKSSSPVRSAASPRPASTPNSRRLQVSPPESPRGPMATSGSPPARIRARSAGSRRPARHDHAVHDRPDHQCRPARHRGRSRRQSVLHRERERRAGSGRSRRRARSASSRRSDRRLRAVGHRERRGRQHLVHRERGESRREAQLRTWRRRRIRRRRSMLRTPRSRAPSRRARRRPPTASTGA